MFPIHHARRNVRLAMTAVMSALGWTAPELFQVDTRSNQTKAHRAVNAYQQTLEGVYADWADETAGKLANADNDTARKAAIAAAIALLLARLKKLGKENLPDAVKLAAGEIPDSLAGMLSDAIDENDSFLEDSLGPAIEDKVVGAFGSSDILAALASGAGATAFAGLLGTMAGRVAMYANAFWKLNNQTKGEVSDGPIKWVLDKTVKDHCSDCSQWGGQEWPSYQDMLDETGGLYPGNPELEDSGNCRCWLEDA